MANHLFQFPLVDSSYDNQEILKCIETLLSGQLTMGPRVKAFEEAFATLLGAEHAVMVNWILCELVGYVCSNEPAALNPASSG